MLHYNFYAINTRKPLSHAFGEVYRPVLTSCAAKRHLEMFTPVFLILSD